MDERVKMRASKDKKQLICNNALELSKLQKQARIKSAGKEIVSRSGSDLLFDNLISVEELAVIFRLAPQTIRNWIARRKIPYVRIGRRNFFQKRSLQKWLIQKEESQWE